MQATALETPAGRCDQQAPLLKTRRRSFAAIRAEMGEIAQIELARRAAQQIAAAGVQTPATSKSLATLLREQRRMIPPAQGCAAKPAVTAHFGVQNAPIAIARRKGSVDSAVWQRGESALAPQPSFVDRSVLNIMNGGAAVEEKVRYLRKCIAFSAKCIAFAASDMKVYCGVSQCTL